MVVMPCLLYGSANASLGASDDVAYLVGRLRQVWPDIDIELRADSGFGVPEMFDACERLRIWYSIGFGMNPVLTRNSQDLLDEAVVAYEQTGQPQRRFTSFEYQSRSWSHQRRTIVKCEVGVLGTNRRAVVTNRLGANLLPGRSTEKVLGAIGLEMADVYEKNGNSKQEIVATYDYTDVDGSMLYQVVGMKPKGFRQRRPDGNSRWPGALEGPINLRKTACCSSSKTARRPASLPQTTNGRRFGVPRC